MSKLNEFLEKKKDYELKCKVAQEMAENARKGFAEFVYDLAKNAKPNEISELVDSVSLEIDDKLAVIACYADMHKGDSELDLYGMAYMLMLEKRYTEN